MKIENDVPHWGGNIERNWKRDVLNYIFILISVFFFRIDDIFLVDHSGRAYHHETISL